MFLAPNNNCGLWSTRQQLQQSGDNQMFYCVILLFHFDFFSFWFAFNFFIAWFAFVLSFVWCFPLYFQVLLSSSRYVTHVSHVSRCLTCS